MAVLVVLLLALSACGSGTPAPTEVSVSGVYTSVAQTLTEGADEATATDTPLPTDTPTLEMTPTITPTLGTSQPFALATSASGLCENSTYVSDVSFADNAEVLPGQTMIKTWKFQNTGTCAWSSDYSLVFVSGTQMGGSTTTIDTTVNSGYQLNVSVTLTAPDTEGTYTGYWQLADSSGNTFGASVYITIVVSDSAPTYTPTITPTPTGTTYTRTPTVTRTITPTRTATSVSSIAVPTLTATPTTPSSTNTPIPPTNTPVPPTNTPVPPTDTPIPPTDTPTTTT
jgi:hypothetical protein